MAWQGRAEYPGSCAHGCGVPVAVGDLIERVRSEPATVGGFGHVVCPDGPDVVADRAALAQPRCPVCTGNHPGEC